MLKKIFASWRKRDSESAEDDAIALVGAGDPSKPATPSIATRKKRQALMGLLAAVVLAAGGVWYAKHRTTALPVDPAVESALSAPMTMTPQQLADASANAASAPASAPASVGDILKSPDLPKAGTISGSPSGEELPPPAAPAKSSPYVGGPAPDPANGLEVRLMKLEAEVAELKRMQASRPAPAARSPESMGRPESSVARQVKVAELPERRVKATELGVGALMTTGIVISGQEYDLGKTAPVLGRLRSVEPAARRVVTDKAVWIIE